jgi:hypothetical protein
MAPAKDLSDFGTLLANPKMIVEILAYALLSHRNL